MCKSQIEEGNSQGKDPRTFQENSQGGDLSTPKTNSQLKHTARERTQEPSKNQLKGGDFRRSGSKRRRKRTRRKNEIQKKDLVEKVQRKDCKFSYSEEERRERKEKQIE